MRMPCCKIRCTCAYNTECISCKCISCANNTIYEKNFGYDVSLYHDCLTHQINIFWFHLLVYSLNKINLRLLREDFVNKLECLFFVFFQKWSSRRHVFNSVYVGFFENILHLLNCSFCQKSYRFCYHTLVYGPNLIYYYPIFLSIQIKTYPCRIVSWFFRLESFFIICCYKKYK